MSNGIDINRLARAMSIEHYHPSYRARVNWLAVGIGVVLVIVALVVILAPEV